ncbi:MAG TPA: N-acetyl-gamma-glutamyl-phosphate reductase [Candidatus Baltobacteraceae bacterium]|nr:N-acetyl-gamma-glutamyl-phosphate reductase [Candidatus Baltobacteraceae bacterium]
MTRVHVVGAAGYAAGELMRLVLRHPHLELGTIESASHAGEALALHFPELRTSTRTFDVPGTAVANAARGDIVVLAGDAAAARAQAGLFLGIGARVVDLSDAFRLHANAGEAVYGLTERYGDALRSARLVANPGCYPTATLLALLPLAPFAADIEQLVVDAKSGITGAGRKPAASSLFAEVDGDVRAYGLDGHRHAAEMVQELAAAGIAAPLLFTPHVVPLRRGLLADCYAFFAREPDDAALRAAFVRAYDGNPFVRILPPERAPSLPALAGTNDAELHVSRKGRVVRILCAIDNLGKGAAGQAVQNINLMLGLPQECSLDDRSVVA